MIKPISPAEVEYIAFRLAREMLAFDEPIPDFSTRFPNVLESCLAVPFQTFSKKVLYSGLIAKASILFYLMVKNHPFQNGNKRIALTTLLYFLYKNKKWLKVEQQDFYNFIIWVAQSPAQVKQETVRGIEKFLRSHLVDL
ncbi:MAG: type II toxin-antitoxin system death-on-curing family toxin [Candidatus Aminicenantes bacterium]|nr:type II toxin-antitoxin system death-on-curing family toxin [Candidatus Aminicenantes bacterium]